MPIQSQINILLTEPNDPSLHYAMQVVYNQYGHNISFCTDPEPFSKEARNPLTTSATGGSEIAFMPSGVNFETYVNDNLIDSISSANAGDNQLIYIEGCKLENGNFVRVKQQATLDGQNKVSLDTPLVRVDYAENINGTDLLGNVYIYQGSSAVVGGVPSDNAKIHLIINYLENRSDKSGTSIPYNKYLIITNWIVKFDKKNSGFTDVKFQIRTQNSVFKSRASITVSDNQNGLVQNANPFYIVQPNSDIRLVGTADSSNTDVSAGYYGYWATII